MKKRRTSVWVNPELVLQMQNKGVEISPFLNRCMTLFLGIPEEPGGVIFAKQTEYIVTQLQNTYKDMMEYVSTQRQAQQQVQGFAKIAADQKSAELLEFGALLQKTSCYPKLLQALEVKNYDSGYWQVALTEINNMNGGSLEFYELWNTALEWYVKIGKNEQVAQPQ